MRESIKNRTDLEVLKVEYDATLTKMDFWIDKYNESQKKVADLEATVRTLTRMKEEIAPIPDSILEEIMA
jgi:hypothetical protein